MKNNQITFLTNNNGTISLYQEKIDGAVNVNIFHNFNDYGKDNITISAGDMVMLINYYRYIKDNNIQCDFINPNGVN